MRMRGTPWPTILYIYTTLYSSPCTHTFKLIRKRNTPAPPLLQCSGAQTASTPPHSTPAQFYQTRLGSLHPIPENTSLRAYIYIVNTNRTINTFPPNTLLGTTPTLPHTTRTKPPRESRVHLFRLRCEHYTSIPAFMRRCQQGFCYFILSFIVRRKLNAVYIKRGIFVSI